MSAIKNRRGLGRGLSALIPDGEMQVLSRLARGEANDLAVSLPTREARTVKKSSTPKVSASTEPSKIGSLDQESNKIKGSPRRQKSGAIRLTLPEAEAASAQVHPEIRSETLKTTSTGEDAAQNAASGAIRWVSVEELQANPFQPRRAFNAHELESLADSLREHGVLQPVLVRSVSPTAKLEPHRTEKISPDNDSSDALSVHQSPQYQIVAGERRWRAARMAGLSRVPVIIKEVADQQALELALIENVQRHDITPLDAALAYKRLIKEFGLSQERVAGRVGKSRAAIANTLRLLDLPADVQKAIEDGELSEGHGRALLMAAGEGARRALFRHVLRDKLSVRDTERLARKTLGTEQEAETLDSAEQSSELAQPHVLGGVPDVAGTRKRYAQARHTIETRRTETVLQERLQTRVRLQPRAEGGQIIIGYFSNEDLERILSLLTREPEK